MDNAFKALGGSGLLCKECGESLTLMYTSHNTSGNDLEVYLLFHCEACHCDWVQTSTFTLKNQTFERKFWG